MSRYTRQIRLREVGEAGQARIAAAEARVTGRGVSAEVCAAYLVGAGIGSLEVGDEAVARAARRVDAGARVRVAALAPEPAPSVLEVHHPAARAIAEGAHRALAELRRLLLSGTTP